MVDGDVSHDLTKPGRVERVGIGEGHTSGWCLSVLDFGTWNLVELYVLLRNCSLLEGSG